QNGTVDLVVHVVERPRVTKIEFAGNRKKETEELEKKLILHAGEVYSATTVQSQVDSLLRFYRDEGFARAQIHADADTSGQQGGVKVRLVIQEGEKVRITRIVFEGASSFPAKQLRKKMKSKQKGFFGGGELKEDEEFPENKDKLEAFYHARGYRDMRVTSQQVRPGDQPRHLTLA